MEPGSRLQPLARAVLRTQADHRLVGLAREGREAAFDEIVRRYRPGLVAFAAAYAPRDSAEDVVQEGFTSAWRALQEADMEIQLKPWLYTIVRNRALNARRDARVHEPLGEEIGRVRGPHEIALTNKELGRAVAAVHALPEPQRRALVRSALDGPTHDQIAAELGSSPGAVGQLVFRARTAVRSGLGVLIPLPLVRLLVEPAGPAAAGATGAGAAAAAAGGGSLLAKGAVVALIGVAAAGSGIAIENASKSDAKDEPSASRPAAGDSSGGSDDFAVSANRSGELEPGDHRGGRGEAESADDHGGGAGPSDDRGGSSSGPGDGSGSSSGGPSANSGPGHSGRGGPEEEVEDVTTTTTTTTTEAFDDSGGDGGSSGSGSDNSGSGSGSGGSSGPG